MKKITVNNIYDWPLTLRLLALTLFAAVVFYFCYSWDISRLSKQLFTARQKENDLKDQLKLLISNQNSLKNDISQSEKLKNILYLWQNQLVTYPALPKIISDILKIGSTNGVQFPLFLPQPQEKQDIYFKVPIKVVGVGNYHQLANFVSQVANMPWIVTINNFSLTDEIKNDVLGVKLAQEAAAQNLLTANFNLEVYYLADTNVK